MIGGNVNWYSHMEYSMEVPQKTKNRSISLVGICPKDLKSAYERDTCTPTFTAGLFIIAKIWNQAKSPYIDE